MKTVLFLIMISFVACKDSKVNERSDIQPKIGSLMNKEAKIAFEALKNKYAATKARGEYTFPDIMPFTLIREIDSLDVEVMPYYNFDGEKFYNDPSPENIVKALSKPDDHVYFAVKRNGEIMYSLMAVKRNGEWVFGEMGEDWGKVISWIPSRLAEVGATSYKIFRPCGLEYVVYEKAGKPIFCRITGEEVQSAEKLCETFVNMMNQAKEDRKYLQEQEKNLPEKYRRK